MFHSWAEAKRRIISMIFALVNIRPNLKLHREEFLGCWAPSPSARTEKWNLKMLQTAFAPTSNSLLFCGSRCLKTCPSSITGTWKGKLSLIGLVKKLDKLSRHPEPMIAICAGLYTASQELSSKRFCLHMRTCADTLTGKYHIHLEPWFKLYGRKQFLVLQSSLLHNTTPKALVKDTLKRRCFLGLEGPNWLKMAYPTPTWHQISQKCRLPHLLRK